MKRTRYVITRFLRGSTGNRISDCRLRIADRKPARGKPLFRRRETRYSAAGMAEPYKCGICDLEEARCLCDKFCCLCHGANNVRLCNDGLWYCIDCREACDLQAQN